MQLPCRLMWANGITWALKITILTNPKKDGKRLATHATVYGSVLNRTVSCADENWGTRWEELAESLRVYALGDVKHSWLLWVTVLGCLSRDLFPDQESALYITCATQAEFVQGLNALVLEFLTGTKLHPDALRRAQTREDLLGSLRYRRTNGDLSERPPTRVELLRF